MPGRAPAVSGRDLLDSEQREPAHGPPPRAQTEASPGLER